MPFVADVDMSKVHILPMVQDKDRKKVDIYRDASSTTNYNRLEFQLCASEEEPLTTRFRLDDPQDKDPTRRGLSCIVEDAKVIAALKTLDERIVAYAVANSKELFKRVLSEEAVRTKYKPLVAHEKDDPELPMLTKFKVKCTGSRVPTRILRLTGPGKVARATEDSIGNRGSKVVPVVSVLGLWFFAGDAQFGATVQAERLIVTPVEARDELADFTLKHKLVVDEEAPVAAGGDDMVLLEEGDSAM